MSSVDALQKLLRGFWGLFVIGTFAAHQIGFFGTQETILYLVFAAAMMVFNNGYENGVQQ